MYENHKAQAEEQLSREPKAFPKIVLSDEITSLDAFRPEHVELQNYEAHPPIKAELTVSGGYNEKMHG